MKPHIQKKLDNRLKGYHQTFRGKFLLLKILSEEEYILWDLSFSVLADWDKKHDETYGTFDYSLAEIAYLLNCSASIVSKRARVLYALGLWRKRADERTEVCGYMIEQFYAALTREYGVIDLQEFIELMRDKNALLKLTNAKKKQHITKEDDHFHAQSDANLKDELSKDSLVSSKGEFSVPFSNDTYKYKLSADDIEWLRNGLEDQESA